MTSAHDTGTEHQATAGHGSGHDSGGADLDTLARVTGRIRASIEKVIEGKPEVAKLAIVVMLSE